MKYMGERGMFPMLLLREPRFIGDWMKYVGERGMFPMLLLREPRFICECM